jgi:hypothetical protein
MASRWIVIFIVALILCGIFPTNSSWQPRDSFDNPVAFMAIGDKLPNVVNKTAPNDFGGAVAIRANLVSLPSFDFSFFRQNQPSWGGLFITKAVVKTVGFFFAIMVILLFSQFYQTARTDSDGDPFRFNKIA